MLRVAVVEGVAEVDGVGVPVDGDDVLDVIDGVVVVLWVRVGVLERPGDIGVVEEGVPVCPEQPDTPRMSPPSMPAPPTVSERAEETGRDDRTIHPTMHT